MATGWKAIRCVSIYKAKKNGNGAVYRLNSRLVAKKIPRNQELTATTPSRQSTQPIHMRTWKKPYTSSNQRAFMMDQTEWVYFKSVSMASNNRDENGAFDAQISWNPLDSKSAQNKRACWLKMKFCFSSMLMTSWLCQKLSRPIKYFKICWSLNSRSKSSESPNTYWGSVWSLWRMGFTLSTPVYWRNCGNFLFLKENKVYTSMQPNSTPRKFLESDDGKFDPHLYIQLVWSLMQLATWTNPDISFSASILYQFFSNPARRHWSLVWRVVNYFKSTQDSVFS